MEMGRKIRQKREKEMGRKMERGRKIRPKRKEELVRKMEMEMGRKSG
jgi:hypothetical protein